MKTIQVELGNRSYPIQVKSGLMQEFPTILSKNNHGQKWVIISQYKLMELFGFELMAQLKDSDFDIDYLTLPIGEAAKSLNEFSGVISQMIKLKCDRSTTILAIGGGVVGDVGGFVASSFMRGIEYYQIPTTLLAMVDSAIGGKTGINFTEGKNLVGAIYQPKGVLIDPKILDTLPKRELISGLSEVIKYGAIWDREFFDQISQWLDDLDSFPFEKAVNRSCEIKAEIVSKDEREDGLRRLLNFGHTIGHAIETLTHYSKFIHGEAVAIGMVYAAKLSQKLGKCKEGTPQRLDRLVRKCGLPADLPDLNSKAIIESLYHDKKTMNHKIKFILVKEIGVVEIVEDMPEEKIISFM